MDHPAGGRLRLIASPAQFSDTTATIRKAAPELGQDNKEILSDAGYNEDTLLRFREKGIIS
ncbi:MAG: hypothetical protein JRH09_09595 [Deltaproteobacteria bacterium]|nr:hypothetical protein [Deltaproteobacteria bacterium]